MSSTDEKMWRPRDWDNPIPLIEEGESRDDYMQSIGIHKGKELGADAILKALKEIERPPAKAEGKKGER